MDYKNTLAAEIRATLLLGDITQHIQGRAATAHALPLRVRKHCKVRRRRQQPRFTPLLQLHAEALCLLLIGRREQNIIPADEVGPVQGTNIILPCILVRLG